MSKPKPHNPGVALFVALHGERHALDDLKVVHSDGRNAKGQYVPGHEVSPELKTKRLATLTSRTKGQPQSPNMNFSGKINWLNRMLSSISFRPYVEQLRAHPARANLTERDTVKLEEFENRALHIQRLASDLHVEIAAWNKGKDMRKIVE